MVVIDTFQSLYSFYAREKNAKFNDIKSLFKWTLIDEGHREPSLKWSLAVREIQSSRKVLFTATPYRNDFNCFEIDKKATFCVSYNELIDFKKNNKPMLRNVRITQKKWGARKIKEFIEKFDDFLKGKKFNNDFKAIISCQNCDDIKKS